MTTKVNSSGSWYPSETDTLIDAMYEVKKENENQQLSVTDQLKKIKELFHNPLNRTDCAIRSKIIKITKKQTIDITKAPPRLWSTVEDKIARDAINLVIEIEKIKNIVIDKNKTCQQIHHLLPDRKMESIETKYDKFLEEQSKDSDVALQSFDLLAMVCKNENEGTPLPKGVYKLFESNLTTTASVVRSEQSSESIPELPLENSSSKRKEDDNDTSDNSQDPFKVKKSPKKKQKTGTQKSNYTNINNSFSVSDFKTIALFSKIMINPKNPTEREIITLQTFLKESHTAEEIKFFLNQN